MITESLINYIKNQNSKNIPKELIISQLIKVGWHMEDIEEGLAKATYLVSEKDTPAPPSVVKEEVKKEYTTDPYQESVDSSSEIPSFIKIRGFKKEEYVNKEPKIEQASVKQEVPKIWTPRVVKPVEEINIQPEKSNLDIDQPIIKPVSTRNLEVFPSELNNSQEKISKSVPDSNIKTNESTLKQDEVIETIPTLKPKDNIAGSVFQSFPSKNKIENSTKDMSKIAMISSYSEDYMSASKLKQEVSTRKKVSLLKSLFIFLIIFIIGGISFVAIRGYVKIPDLKFSFVKKDSKDLIFESAMKFNSLQSYKTETEAKISFPSFSEISLGLLGDGTIDSKNEDHFTLLSKGEITKLESDSNFYDYDITLSSSILEKDIRVGIKNDGIRSYVDIPDLSPIYKDSPSLSGIVSLPSDKIEDLAILLPDNLDNTNKDLIGGVLKNFIKNELNKSSLSFDSFFDDIEVVKKEEENINNIKTNHYILNGGEAIFKDILSKSSAVLSSDLSKEEKDNFEKVWSFVTLNSLEVWIGENDNNLYKYKFSLKIPLSKVIGLEEESIANKEIVLDWQTTFYDFNVANSVIVPISESMSFGDFSNKVKDLKIKNAVSSLVISTGEMKKVLGNYGLKSNTIGSCINPVSGSLFSRVGHTKNVSMVVEKISSILKVITDQTGENSRCFSTSKAWAVSVPLPSDTNIHFCLDSAGNSLELKGPITKTSCK